MGARGNPNPVGGKPDKLIRDALLACARNEPEKLKRVAKKMWDLAEEGDTKAFGLIADRIDGKAIQPLAHNFAPETQNDESLDAQLAQLARKAGIAIITAGQAPSINAAELPIIH